MRSLLWYVVSCMAFAGLLGVIILSVGFYMSSMQSIDMFVVFMSVIIAFFGVLYANIGREARHKLEMDAQTQYKKWIEA